MKGSCRKLGAGGYRETIFIGRPLSTWLRPCVGGYFVYSQWSTGQKKKLSIHTKKSGRESVGCITRDKILHLLRIRPPCYICNLILITDIYRFGARPVRAQRGIID